VRGRSPGGQAQVSGVKLSVNLANESTVGARAPTQTGPERTEPRLSDLRLPREDTVRQRSGAREAAWGYFTSP